MFDRIQMIQEERYNQVKPVIDKINELSFEKSELEQMERELSSRRESQAAYDIRLNILQLEKEIKEIEKKNAEVLQDKNPLITQNDIDKICNELNNKSVDKALREFEKAKSEMIKKYLKYEKEVLNYRNKTNLIQNIAYKNELRHSFKQYQLNPGVKRL